jgi:hypothetical protein
MRIPEWYEYIAAITWQIRSHLGNRRICPNNLSHRCPVGQFDREAHPAVAGAYASLGLRPGCQARWLHWTVNTLVARAGRRCIKDRGALRIMSPYSPRSKKSFEMSTRDSSSTGDFRSGLIPILKCPEFGSEVRTNLVSRLALMTPDHAVGARTLPPTTAECSQTS